MHLPLDISSVNSLKYTHSKDAGDPSMPSTCCYSPSHPEVRLAGNQVAALFGTSKPVPGQVYEGSFQFKVVKVEVPDEEDDKEGCVELKLIAAEDLEDAAETDEDPEAE